MTAPDCFIAARRRRATFWLPAEGAVVLLPSPDPRAPALRVTNGSPYEIEVLIGDILARAAEWGAGGVRVAPGLATCFAGPETATARCAAVAARSAMSRIEVAFERGRIIAPAGEPNGRI